MNDKKELRHILSDTESHQAERTTSTDNMDKFCQTICAFSNDISGSGKNGYLILGVHNNGELSGLKVTDKLLLQIANIRTDGNILPQPVMTVEKFSFEEGEVLVAEVQPSEFPPVRYRGRVWVRVGPRKSIASEAEIKILTERRLSNIHTFDAMPCLGTTINDLDVKLIKKDFLPKAVAEDVLAEDKRSIEEQLASLGFYDLRYGCPTNGAIVLFGINPQRYLPGSYIQYVHFKGYDRGGDIINEHKFSGNLCVVLPKIDTFIETSISQKRPIPVSVLREETFSKYPYWATRELLMNSIMHRDYETSAPIHFYEYDDRIEVQNHGGLYGRVTPSNFPNVSDYRNPFIAEAMKVLGYVNRFSRGVYRVQKELEENGNGKAIFDFSLVTAFRVVEKVSKMYFQEGFGQQIVEDSGKGNAEEYVKNSNLAYYQKTIQQKIEKSQRKAKEKPKKSQRKAKEKPKRIEDEILKLIKETPEITILQISENLGRTIDSTRYYLRKMTSEGVIKHEGPTKSGKWVVLSQ